MSGSEPTFDDQTRAELLALPGSERVIWGGANLEPGSLPTTSTTSTTSTWFSLVAAMTERMSEELGLGRAELLTISYANRMIAVAIDDEGAIMALIANNPSTLGLAMVKLRRWLSGRTRSQP